MIKLIRSTTCVLVIGGAAHAQEQEAEQTAYPSSPVNFQLLPDVSGESEQLREEHNVGFGLVGGDSGKLHGFGVGLLSYRVHEGGGSGGIFSFVYTETKGDFSGIQFSYLGANVAQQDFSGLQGSLIGNYAGGESLGMQLGFVGNIAGGAFTGVQAGFAGNFARGPVLGLQAAFVGNIVKEDLIGVQASTGINWLGGTATGLQVATINYAGGVRGAQIGLVNVTKKVMGVQIGLVNYASHSTGPAIGVLNIVGNGVLDSELFFDETNTYGVRVKLGSRYFYNYYEGGVYTRGGTSDEMLGFGIGSHYTLQNFSVGTLLGVRGYKREEDRENFSVTRLNITGRYTFANRVYLSAGPTYSRAATDSSRVKAGLGGEPGFQLREVNEEAHWYGYELGFGYQFLN